MLAARARPAGLPTREAVLAANWDLAGKSAIITGASSGLGAHFAGVLAAAGAEVCLAARRPAELASVAAGIRSAGGRCRTLVMDVSDPASLFGLAAEFERTDILVNNAGVAREGAMLEQTEADWDLVVDTNLKGMFFMAQAVARGMQTRGQGGCIINIASILGIRQGSGVLPYAVSKAGAIQMTKTMALELARHRIRVNALAPGYFATALNAAFWQTEAGQATTKRIPQRRLGRLEDLDGPLLLLASDASAYMTGSVITVDGGHLVSGL